MNNNSKLKICFAASSGGHYEQLMMLRPLMEKYNGFVVTESTGYEINSDRKTYRLLQVNRHEKSFFPRMLVNSLKSGFILLKERPNVVITTGVLSCIPISLLCKFTGGKLIYIESFAKVTSATKTGKLLYKYADRFYVQWKSMLEIYPNAIFVGSVY